jgi:hypothetical protein
VITVTVYRDPEVFAVPWLPPRTSRVRVVVPLRFTIADRIGTVGAGACRGRIPDSGADDQRVPFEVRI